MFRADDWKRSAQLLRLLLAYSWFNLRASYAFRTNFWFSIFSMVLNDSVWLVYWILFFNRFPSLHGWGRSDVLLLWGISASSFGVMNVLFGNLLTMQQLVQMGELDVYLCNPKPVLLHALISRQSVSAWGDVLFGLAVLLAVAPHTATGLWNLALALVSSCLLFFGFVLLTQCMGFITGGGQGIGVQLVNAYLSFQTYPPTIFQGWLSKLIIYVLIPSGIIALMPWPILLGERLWLPYVSLAVGGLLTLLARFVFYKGLQSYTSGNRITIRS